VAGLVESRRRFFYNASVISERARRFRDAWWIWTDDAFFLRTRTFWKRLTGTTIMKLQCACLRLAVRSTPPVPAVRTSAHEPPKAANDNQTVWPFVPFPSGWHASSWLASS